MNEKYRVSLQSLIDEFALEAVSLPGPASDIYVKTTELNRPALALSGFFDLFEPERIQLIGNAEHCYLSKMDDDERNRRIDAFIDRRPVAVIVTGSSRSSSSCITRKNAGSRSCGRRRKRQRSWRR